MFRVRLFRSATPVLLWRRTGLSFISIDWVYTKRLMGMVWNNALLANENGVLCRDREIKSMAETMTAEDLDMTTTVSKYTVDTATICKMQCHRRLSIQNAKYACTYSINAVWTFERDKFRLGRGGPSPGHGGNQS